MLPDSKARQDLTKKEIYKPISLMNTEQSPQQNTGTMNSTIQESALINK